MPSLAPAVATPSATVLALQRAVGNRTLAREFASRRLDRRGGPYDLREDAPGTRSPRPATPDNLQSGLEHRLGDWKREAEQGVDNFADAELERTIQDATSMNVAAFVGALAGNIVWAAACFVVDAPVAAFALSLYGIGIASVAAIPPAPDETPLMWVKGRMLAILDVAYQHLIGQIPKVSGAVLKDNPSIDVDAAIEKIMTASFRRQFITPSEQKRDTEVNLGAVREVYQSKAAEMLAHYKAEVQPIGVTTAVPGSIAPRVYRIVPGGLALLDQDSERPELIFRHWIDSDMEEAALARAKELNQEVRTLPINVIKGVPLGSAATRDADAQRRQGAKNDSAPT